MPFTVVLKYAERGTEVTLQTALTIVSYIQFLTN